MTQTNERPGITHDRLMKELNRFKTDLNSEGNIDTDLTKRQIRSRTLVVSTPRVPSPSQMTTVGTTGPNSNTPQKEQDPSSARFNSSENEGSYKDIKGHRPRITKSNKTNKKPSPPFKSIKTHKHHLETQKNHL